MPQETPCTRLQDPAAASSAPTSRVGSPATYCSLISLRASSAKGCNRLLLGCGYSRKFIRAPRRDEAFRDPLIGPRQALFERDRRFPTKYNPQARVVAVAAADALWLCQIVAPIDPFAR